MPAQPPSSSEGSSLSPRHRPMLGSIAQDTTEVDLWEFDEDEHTPPAAEPPQAGMSNVRPFGSDLPAPRDRPRGKEGSLLLVSSTSPAKKEHIRLNISKAPVAKRSAGRTTEHAKPERDFDDLEQWDFTPGSADDAIAPAAAVDEWQSEPISPPTPEPPQPEEGVEPEALMEEDELATLTEQTPDEVVPGNVASGKDEVSTGLPTRAKPLALRPHLGLSAVERIGLISLLVILLAGGGAVWVYSLNLLPTESRWISAQKFPVSGSYLNITAAQSYWRTPIMEGAFCDTFRRGTQLLPVLEVTVAGGPAAIRVLFRNESRVVVGDAVTRTVRGSGTLQIPATAGFDELGMHAAYRTGESKPWTIEVLEAPTEDTTGTGYKKLFEMDIATDRR